MRVALGRGAIVMAVAERDVAQAGKVAWREVAAATLRPGDRIVCREYLGSGESKRAQIVVREVVLVRVRDDLVLYRTNSPSAARHARAPSAPVRLWAVGNL